MAQHTLNRGKVKFGSFLAKEAWILKMNIMDLYYVYDQNKHLMFAGDKAIMLSSLKMMVTSHKRMLKELAKTGEFTGNIKDVKYRVKITKKNP